MAFYSKFLSLKKEHGSIVTEKNYLEIISPSAINSTNEEKLASDDPNRKKKKNGKKKKKNFKPVASLASLVPMKASSRFVKRKGR